MNFERIERTAQRKTMRILLIDDEPGVTENLVEYLEDDLHHVEVLNYLGDEEHLRQTLQEFRPEGVILDYDMAPSGAVVYEWIKRWEPSTPVIFYTKYATSPHQRTRMIEAGASESRILPKVEAADDVQRLIRALES